MKNKPFLYSAVIDSQERSFTITSPKELCQTIGKKRLVHIMAEIGDLDQIPSWLWVKEIFQIGDYRGYNVAHIAASAGHLDQIPSGILESVLETRNLNDRTPAHTAAFHGHLNQIPVKLITPKLICSKGKTCKSVAFVALNSETPQQLSQLLERLKKSRMPSRKIMEISDSIIRAIVLDRKEMIGI